MAPPEIYQFSYEIIEHYNLRVLYLLRVEAKAVVFKNLETY